jgi:hypothetical protein
VRHSLPLLLAFAGSAAVSAAPVPKNVQNELYYPTKVGAKWTYSSKTEKGAASEITEVVTDVEKKGDGVYHVSVGRPFKDRVSVYQKIEVSGKGLFRVGAGGGAAMTPPRTLLKVGAKPGDTWEHKPGEKQGQPGKYVFRGEEEVEVPAGKYKALKVEAEIEFTKGRPSQVTYWYAVGVGPVKTVTKNGDSERVQVLKAFDPGKD